MPHKQPKTANATFYAVVIPQWSRWMKDEGGRPILEGAKVERVTQSRPQTVKGDAVVTRLTLSFEVAAFLPLQPQAVIHIAADQAEVIVAEASDPAADQP